MLWGVFLLFHSVMTSLQLQSWLHSHVNCIAMSSHVSGLYLISTLMDYKLQSYHCIWSISYHLHDEENIMGSKFRFRPFILVQKSVEMPVHEITYPNIGGGYFMYSFSPCTFGLPWVRVPQSLFHSHQIPPINNLVFTTTSTSSTKQINRTMDLR